MRTTEAPLVASSPPLATTYERMDDLQRHSDVQHTEWKELVLKMVPNAGDPDFQGYRCPTAACLFKSSAEADIREHCLEDCEDQVAYNQMYEEDRAFREDSITAKDPGRPSNRVLMSRLEKKNQLVHDIVESATKYMVGLEVDPVMYADFRSEMAQAAELYASGETSTQLKNLAVTLGRPLKSFDEMENEFQAVYQSMVAEYASKL